MLMTSKLSIIYDFLLVRQKYMMNMNETHSLIHSHGLIHRSVGKERVTFKRHESDEPLWPLRAVKLSLSVCWHTVDEESVSAEIISKPALIDHFTLQMSVITQHHPVDNNGTARNGSNAFTYIYIYTFGTCFYPKQLVHFIQFKHSHGIEPKIFAFLEPLRPK